MAPPKKDDNQRRDVRCYKPKKPPPDEFYRPLLMSVEFSRPKKSCCCSRTRLYPPQYYCPQCNPNEMSPFSRHPAYLNNLSCIGNNACGSCSTGNAATCADTGPCGQTAGSKTCGRGPGMPPPPPQQQLAEGCTGNVMPGCGGGGWGGGFGGGCRYARLPGQGPCDPPCFSTMIFPRYSPFVPEPKCQPHPIIPSVISDGCAGASVGGTSMYGAFTRSCFTCNNCGIPGQVDVCGLPCAGCNNAACASGYSQPVSPCGVMGPPGLPGGGSYPGPSGSM